MDARDLERRRNLLRKRHGPRPGPWRLLTAERRALPDVVVVGAQRAGTTSLFRYLAQHPRSATPLRKEVHYFDHDPSYARGERWFRAHFPTRAELGSGASRKLVLEGTPATMYRPAAPARLRALLPDARLIAILRDPIERALSNHKLVAAWGGEYGPFELEVEHELCCSEGRTGPLGSRPPRGLIARGRYSEQLERLLALYPREQLLVLDARSLFADPAATMRSVFAWLGLDAITVDAGRAHNHSRDRSGMAPETRARLRDHFAPWNAALWELLGADWGWGAEG